MNERNIDGTFAVGHKHDPETIAKISKSRKGKCCGDVHHARRNEQPRGEKAHAWGGGKIKHQRGYILVFCPDHPYRSSTGYVYEHRLMMEKLLGRFLEKSEIVHHKNGITSDNRIANLEIFTSQADHLKKHANERRMNCVSLLLLD